MIDYQFPYWGPFILEAHINREFVDLLLSKGRETKIDARKYLAGKLDKEFYYENYEDWFLPKFTPYMDLYVESLLQYQPNALNYLYADLVGTTLGRNNPETFFFPGGDEYDRPWTLDDLWINFQQSGEYNPPHNHTGDMSFVIFLQVPKELVREYEQTKDDHNSEGPGVICFQYGERLPFNISRYWRMPTEGMIIMFPAWVQHYVHSFNSDVERITVSGNIRFKK